MLRINLSKRLLVIKLLFAYLYRDRATQQELYYTEPGAARASGSAGDVIVK